uniref:Nuclear protein 2, transcriptional regulator n=1 Tax=Chelonoidis abingdonii TaxID=106734 RepID=A0A8C0GXL1_CHEAB
SGPPAPSAGLGPARPQEAAPPGAEEAEARYDPYEWYNVREWGGPRGPGSGGKGRSRRERELRTNRYLPAGHERKIAQKLRNSQAKRRQSLPSMAGRVTRQQV